MKKAIIKSMAEVHAVDVEWLWKPYLPRGKVSIIRGMPGDGKSMFVMALIAALTTGRPLFNEENFREPVVCVYQSAEVLFVPSVLAPEPGTRNKEQG